jgi:hypothetical protein
MLQILGHIWDIFQPAYFAGLGIMAAGGRKLLAPDHDSK